ncbi:hypothetical protein D3W54_04070 [Komagataeibacter medellinensis]|uniref:Uncharacterized protein n=1 Tax=Komagataeibacter medellinensis TaxID=1177712 RepID=A0ABQ6VYL3_9PROT|nr:hypothetical protein D3W54_04070 [Komagataeibacter medellinensis]
MPLFLSAVVPAQEAQTFWRVSPSPVPIQTGAPQISVCNGVRSHAFLYPDTDVTIVTHRPILF